MCGEVVEPRAIGTAAAFLIFVLGKGVVLRIFAGPRDGTSCSSSQAQGSVLVVGACLSVMGLVLPCQFSSLTILIHQLQESFPGVCSYQTLAYSFGAPDVHELVHAEFCPPLLGIGLEGLHFL
jgi:hypothetical protein